MSNSLQLHKLQHSRLPYPSLSPEVCSNSYPLSWWCHPTISFSATPFSSCLQSFSVSGSFPVSQIFTSGGPSIGASALASVLPMNIQSWFPLRLVWSPCFPRDSQQTFPASQFKSMNSSLLSSSLTWLLERHSLNYTDVCLCFLIHCLGLSYLSCQETTVF